jgi:excinuclease ABC subunit C
VEPQPQRRPGERGLDQAGRIGPRARPAGRAPAVAAGPGVRALPGRTAGAQGGIGTVAGTAALAFEFAARLRQEIEALAWVTAEQKVTRSAPEDFDVCGWADGALVRFTIRGGRLSGWYQDRCDAAAARRQQAATPPEWAAFAQRNAELAARLADHNHLNERTRGSSLS